MGTRREESLLPRTQTQPILPAMSVRKNTAFNADVPGVVSLRKDLRHPLSRAPVRCPTRPYRGRIAGLPVLMCAGVAPPRLCTLRYANNKAAGKAQVLNRCGVVDSGPRGSPSGVPCVRGVGSRSGHLLDAGIGLARADPACLVAGVPRDCTPPEDANTLYLWPLGCPRAHVARVSGITLPPERKACRGLRYLPSLCPWRSNPSSGTKINFFFRCSLRSPVLRGR